MFTIQQVLHKYLIESLWWSLLWFRVLLDLSIDHGVLVLSAWGCLVLNRVGVSIQGVSRRWGSFSEFYKSINQ